MTSFIRSELKNGRTTLLLQGEWNIAHLTELRSSSHGIQIAGGQDILIDCRQLGAMDTCGASQLLALKRRLSGSHSVQVSNLPQNFKQLVSLVEERLGTQKLPEARSLSLIQSLGLSSSKIFVLVTSLIAFIGETAFGVLSLIKRPSLFRWREFAMQLKVACVDAVPISALVTFLIGIVVAYLSSIQIEKFGANIFIVDAVSLALARELSPIIVAVVVAGRSGSAFTAQLGTMKLNEEIDAITTIGLSPQQVLVLPRLFALMIAMPLLVFVGDVAGTLGSMLIAKTSLGITPTTYLDRLQAVLPVRSFMVGLVKAPVFAAFIAVIGCKMGMSVENNARSVGLHTTSTVVQSIVAVILLNAAFAVIFVELGI
ncbi:MAG: ABC transporter permease [Deltaproteobacteria bacterium]|nr:ABC transporter permease [Deltaproteobacteria bacterium]